MTQIAEHARRVSVATVPGRGFDSRRLHLPRASSTAWRVMIPPEAAAALRRLIEEALRSAPWPHQREAAMATGALPVYSGWTAELVITEAGEVMEFDHDTKTVRLAREECWRTIALVRAARCDPALRCLAPLRPPDARECKACGGSGIVLNSASCGDCFEKGWTD